MDDGKIHGEEAAQVMVVCWAAWQCETRRFSMGRSVTCHQCSVSRKW